MAASRVSKDQGGGRDLQAAYRDIGTMCDVISLPRSIVDTSKQLFKRVDEEKLLKGKSQDAIIAACIFIACRQGRVARTFKEIVALTNVPKKVSFPPFADRSRQLGADLDSAGHRPMLQGPRARLRDDYSRSSSPFLRHFRRLAHHSLLQPSRPARARAARQRLRRHSRGRGGHSRRKESHYHCCCVHPLRYDALGRGQAHEGHRHGRWSPRIDDSHSLQVS